MCITNILLHNEYMMRVYKMITDRGELTETYVVD
jgi:hypothetical protein